MKTTTLRINPFILKTLTVLAVVPISATAPAGVVNATYNAASEVPVTANGYTATGNTVNFTLSFAPATGTELMMVNPLGRPFR